jgi:hypothetical protein
MGKVSMRGFFGGEHKRNHREWDAHSLALWTIELAANQSGFFLTDWLGI